MLGVSGMLMGGCWVLLGGLEGSPAPWGSKVLGVRGARGGEGMAVDMEVPRVV